MDEKKFQSRKFVVTMVVLIQASLLIWFKIIDADTFFKLSSAVVGLYFTGNVAAKFADKRD